MCSSMTSSSCRGPAKVQFCTYVHCLGLSTLCSSIEKNWCSTDSDFSFLRKIANPQIRKTNVPMHCMVLFSSAYNHWFSLFPNHQFVYKKEKSEHKFSSIEHFLVQNVPAAIRNLIKKGLADRQILPFWQILVPLGLGCGLWCIPVLGGPKNCLWQLHACVPFGTRSTDEIFQRSKFQLCCQFSI